LKSEARRGEGDVLYITPTRLTSNVLSSGFEGFSKAAAWLSHEETSHCEKDRLAVGYSVRSWLRIAVLSVRSRMVMWVFALGAK
jgi:hypothetical protein